MADIKETLDVLTAAENILSDVADAYADGSLSVFEEIKVALKDAPSLVAAISGASLIPSELKDLSPEELKALADKGLEVANAALKLFSILGK